MICKIAFVLGLIAGNTLAQQDSTAFTHQDPYYDAGFRDGAGSWEISNPAGTADEEVIVDVYGASKLSADTVGITVDSCLAFLSCDMFHRSNLSVGNKFFCNSPTLV